jgi:hypothetical protein
MLNFFEIEIKRVVVHSLYAKEDGNEHSLIYPDNKLTELTENVKSLLIERLSKAAAKTSKAFELEIDDYYEGSFFSIAKEISKTDDNEFIAQSVQIAHLLAQSQTRNTLPGGYILIIDAVTKYSKKVAIVIKAELNTVLKYYNEDDKSVIKMLDDVFLSPSQKFFKIGIIYEREEDNQFFSYPNNRYGCFLFDDQFKPDSRPAEYFYKDFLGFSIDSNSKIQSKRFFDITDKYIRKTIPNPEFKDEMLNVLKHEFLSNDESEISPSDFADMYFPEEELRNGYKNQVINYLPENISKDPSLIETKLNKKKINFPNKVTVSGPSNIFDYNVKVIKSIDDINEEDLGSSDITILKITGKPYQEQ